MKSLLILASFLSLPVSSPAQQTEFELFQNGLIYADTTVHQLKYIVDSLNLKFLSCDLHKTYLAKWQARAHYIELNGTHADQGLKDIRANIHWETFVDKYPDTTIRENILLTRHEYDDYNGKPMLEFNSINLSNSSTSITFQDNPDQYTIPLSGKWIYNYHPNNYLYAFYITEEFLPGPFPKEYARMIQYSECLVDTNHRVITATVQTPPSSNVTNFTRYVHAATKRPVFNKKGDEDAYENYYLKIMKWDSTRLTKADSLHRHDPKFTRLFQSALTEAIAQGGSSDEFEEYVERYASPQQALALKRNRIVIGNCSMDTSPRDHALQIARLSAETINWDIFLRAHLDIMNDNFERASDGSWAFAGRQTYIQELEVLDINVADLLLGISFRLENPCDNHYFGSVQRTGRALSESKDREEIENRMLGIIADSTLDTYNRMVFYYLFLNYNDYLEEAEQTENKLRLAEAKNTLPIYILTAYKE